MPLRVGEFTLPPELEAHEPPEARGLRRDAVRLLVTDRASDSVSHARFYELPDFLAPGDLVVVNDSGTLPAELDARRADGMAFPLRLSTRLGPDLWAAEPRRVRVASVERFELPDGASALVLGPYLGSPRLWIVRLTLPVPLLPYLLHWGRPIRYDYVPDPWPLEMYETVYQRERGSAEMPSAGRPFSQDVLAQLDQRGIRLARVTLHTGVSSLESDELPYPEWFHVSGETAQAVNATRASGHRVVAVGTTVVRALESAATDAGEVRSTSGWTDLVVTPQRGVRAVDALLTGFHEPRSTHLAMLEAIAGPEHIERAYRVALDNGYLWHEFGDVHLIL